MYAMSPGVAVAMIDCSNVNDALSLTENEC